MQCQYYRSYTVILATYSCFNGLENQLSPFSIVVQRQQNNIRFVHKGTTFQEVKQQKSKKGQELCLSRRHVRRPIYELLVLCVYITLFQARGTNQSSDLV